MSLKSIRNRIKQALSLMAVGGGAVFTLPATSCQDMPDAAAGVLESAFELDSAELSFTADDITAARGGAYSGERAAKKATRKATRGEF